MPPTRALSALQQRLVERGHSLDGNTQMTKAAFTIDFVEGKLMKKRWCAYHGTFHDLDGFSQAQKIAAFGDRYCKGFFQTMPRVLQPRRRSQSSTTS